VIAIVGQLVHGVTDAALLICIVEPVASVILIGKFGGAAVTEPVA
jgi:hypothetical protein